VIDDRLMIIIPSMRHALFTACLWLLAACASSTPPQPAQTSLLLYHFERSAFLEYSANLQAVRELPFAIPPQCGLYDTFPAPLGPYLLIELDCPGGQTVLFFDTAAPDATLQPITTTDAHFLAWTSDGSAAYLRIDSLGNPRIIRAQVTGGRDELAIDEYTYDLAAKPGSDDFLFTLSRGFGFGSELALARQDGRVTTLLLADPANYISFARFSPDGSQIALIKIPDSQIPFTVGELWVIGSDGSNPRKLADADAGHGYAANWSPDGTRIAFVVRENPADAQADRVSEALISNLYLVETASGEVTQLTQFENAQVSTAYWSPEGNTLVFAAVADGRMSVFSADVASGEIRLLETGPACCPAWMRK
jgi:dipeptidyl aminopeptidase/acylaminoacyl peptidase